MKLTNFLISLTAVICLTPTALGWSNEDHEIFDIVSGLQLAEGKDTTFYSFLSVAKDASEKEISKAYRKKSLELHPDKNPDDEVVAERFARMGTIASILRDSEKRERYDFFYENGVPKWRGTGYYYSRYRPGFGFVVACLGFFSCFVQWIFLKGKTRMEIMRFNQFLDQTKALAWGPSKVPVAGRKRVPVQTAPGPGLAAFGGDSSLTSQGQYVELVWVGHDCFLVEADDSETLLTSDVIARYSVLDTWIPALIISTYQSITGTTPPPVVPKEARKPPNGRAGPPVHPRLAKKRAEEEKKNAEVVEVVKKVKGPTKGVEGAGKIGGRRRKEISRPSTPKKDE